MSNYVDNAIALRIIYLLITPFNQTDAFKLGIIDASGLPLKKAGQLKTNKEKDSYSMLHRLVFRLKRVLGTIPFGQTNFASYAAAYLLVKESIDDNSELEDLEELFISKLNNGHYTEDSISLVESALNEDGEPTNTTSGIEDSVPRIYPKDIKKYHQNNKSINTKSIKYKKFKSRKIFNMIPKEGHTLYQINDDLIFIE